MGEIGLAGLLLDYPHSGSAVYARNLVPLLPEAAPDLSFRLFLRNSKFRPPAVATQRLSTPFAAANQVQGLWARLDKLTWEVAALPLAAAARREPLVHYLYFAAPILSPAPFVVTVHDLIPLVLPNYYRSRQAALYSAIMARTVKRAAAVITVSQHSRSDIVRVLGIPPERVHVTYEAVDERFLPGEDPAERNALRLKYGLPPTYLLYTGGAEKRKNLTTLVRAWARLQETMRDENVHLVIVANFPPADRLYPDIPALSRDLGITSSLVFLRQVDEEDKPALYRSALAFCFPSMYEGFGFTPLEAMASGVPVIASRAASIPEIVGNAGCLLPPDDVDSWADALLHLVRSAQKRAELRARGLDRAASFSWRRTAQETVDVYRQVLER